MGPHCVHAHNIQIGKRNELKGNETTRNWIKIYLGGRSRHDEAVESMMVIVFS